MTEKELIEWLQIYQHKIRNPLHALGLNLDVLRSRLKKLKVDEKYILKHLDIAINESKQLEKLTTLFVDYLKLSDKQRKQTDFRTYLERSIHG